MDEASILARIEWLTRRQLARRLHDGPAQSAAALAMRAGLAKRELATKSDSVESALEELEDLARQTARELRELQFALSPLPADVDFGQALDRLVTHFNKSFGAKIELQVNEQAAVVKDLKVAQELVLISAELLDNTCRHAEAKRISLSVSRPEPAALLLEAQDNGIGFDLERDQPSFEAEQRYGLALVGERVRLMNGEVHIESQPGMGTNVRVAIPIQRL